MRIFPVLLLALQAAPATAQVALVSDDYFPAALEFRELGPIRSEVDKPAGGSGLDPDLLREAGLRRYTRRVYATEGGGSLVIEILVLEDGKGAYSLLTLLGDGPLERGAPGDFHRRADSALALAQGHVFARLEGGDPTLRRRVAVSVGNRIGAHDPAPMLVSRFPAPGLVPESVRYFLGPKALGRYGSAGAVRRLEIPADVEVAEARYRAGDHSGTLLVASFPTSQLAEEYYEKLFRSGSLPESGGAGLFFRRSGPIVGVLEGTFDALAADRLLGGLQFSYTVQWIFDRQNHAPRSVFGVPVAILGTVVRSIFFTALLCGLSIGAGILIAMTRVGLRVWAPGNFLDRPDRTGLIRLKLDEN
jgi:hypothetical protein